MKKSILWVSTLVVLVVAVSVWYYFNFSWDLANANPDYICVKPSTSTSCIITNIWEWQSDGTRIKTWVRALEVWYYHTRTSCETGYTTELTWNTASSSSASTNADQSSLDAEWRAATISHPSSWRHSSDFTYSSETCTIVEIDDTVPVWVFK